MTRGTFLAAGSYKSAYGIVEDPDKVLIVIREEKEKELIKEARNLTEMSRAGVRVPIIFGSVDRLGKGEVGLLMENLKGGVDVVEVKERDFGRAKSKAAFVAAAGGLGFDNVIRQLQAVKAFSERPGSGIVDCQFFVSGKKGCVLFDPASLGSSEPNGGLQQMINYLTEEKARTEAKAAST